jgi:hypothetical protein
MRKIAFFALLALTGCANALDGKSNESKSHLETQTIMSPEELAHAKQKIGKSFWASGRIGLYVCAEPDGRTRCDYVNSGKFVVQDLETRKARTSNGIIELPGHLYKITFTGEHGFTNGHVGYADASSFDANVTEKDPAIAVAECKRRGNPRVGMTADQVTATCWGKPEHVNRTETGTHISDQYVYSSGRYVYLENGIVTSIQSSGTLR